MELELESSEEIEDKIVVEDYTDGSYAGYENDVEKWKEKEQKHSAYMNLLKSVVEDYTDGSYAGYENDVEKWKEKEQKHSAYMNLLKSDVEDYTDAFYAGYENDVKKRKEKEKKNSAYMKLLKSGLYDEDHSYTSLIIEVYKDMLDYTHTDTPEEGKYQLTKREELCMHRISDLEIQTAEAKLGKKLITVSYIKNILEDLHQNTVMTIYEHLRSCDDDRVYAQLQPKDIKDLFFNIKSTIGCSFSAEINTFATGKEKWSLKEQVFIMRIKELEQKLSNLQQQMQSRPEQNVENADIEERTRAPSCSGNVDLAKIKERRRISSRSTQDDEVSTIIVRETRRDLLERPWFVGLCSIEQATSMLKMHKELHGLFIVRELRNSPGTYAVDVNEKGVPYTMVIMKRKNAYSIDNGQTEFSSISGLVSYYHINSLREAYPYLTTTLLIPYHFRTKW
ncbi:uncharacterized protein [Watersipora subatra]|uniref:uncharacterized protein isoform X1 n=1 Tax=Watersipora subatra TaxID=2589382 RepID=UPI00355B8259